MFEKQWSRNWKWNKVLTIENNRSKSRSSGSPAQEARGFWRAWSSDKPCRMWSQRQPEKNVNRTWAALCLFITKIWDLRYRCRLIWKKRMKSNTYVIDIWNKMESVAFVNSRTLIFETDQINFETRKHINFKQSKLNLHERINTSSELTFYAIRSSLQKKSNTWSNWSFTLSGTPSKRSSVFLCGFEHVRWVFVIQNMWPPCSRIEVQPCK